MNYPHFATAVDSPLSPWAPGHWIRPCMAAAMETSAISFHVMAKPDLPRTATTPMLEFREEIASIVPSWKSQET